MAPATVLLIDSDVDSIEIYSMLLRHHGYAVIHAHDAETGFRLAYEAKPDVVVSEIYLPPLRGGEVVDRLRRDGRTSTTPLIVLDSIPNFGSDSNRPLGAFSRLRKPCEPSRLLHEIERILDHRVAVTPLDRTD